LSRNIRYGNKNSFYNNNLIYQNKQFQNCFSRHYDLCINNTVIKGLKLNGYIGIALNDSLKSHFNRINRFLGGNLSDTLLYRSSALNNEIEKNNEDDVVDILIKPPNFNTFYDFIKQERVFGIPEICIIPYDIHNYNEHDYLTTYNNFTQEVNNNTNNVLSEQFIFKPVNSLNAPNVYSLVSNVAEYIENNSHIFKKSAQAYPLFNVIPDEMDEEQRNLYVLNDNYEPTNNFFDTYAPDRKPNDLCAFELLDMYYNFNKSLNTNSINGATVGGKYIYNSLQNNIENNIKKNIKNNKLMENNSVILPKPSFKEVKNKNFYYKEVNRIPILLYIPDNDKKQKINNIENNKNVKNGGKKTKKYNKKTTKYNKKLNISKKLKKSKTKKRK
jgi:hypothetical protein